MKIPSVKGLADKGLALMRREPKNDLYRPRTSEVVTQPFIDHVCSIYQLDHFGHHGIEHWLRVLHNGRLIAESVGANLKVVELFALLHDTQRLDEWEDPDHGKRAAKYAQSIRGEWFDLTNEEMWQLQQALSLHTDGLIVKDPTIGACWDADRLDLARVGMRPDPQYLCHAFSKQKQVINQAIARSTATRT